DPSLIRAIQALNVPIATTNYDGLIEDVTGLPPITWRQRTDVERFVNGDKPGVLHLHGYWNDPASVVLGIRSYEEVLKDSHIQAILRGFVITRTLVFVGCGGGLDDPNFKALLDWIREVFAGSSYKHYRLVIEKEARALRKTDPGERLIVPQSYGKDYAEL